VPGDGIFTAWSCHAGAGRAQAFLLNPQPLPARTAHEWGVVAEVVPNGKALSRAQALAELYLKAPEVTRRNTRVHFIHPLKERIVREVGYGLSLEGASVADLVKSMQAQTAPLAQSGSSRLGSPNIDSPFRSTALTRSHICNFRVADNRRTCFGAELSISAHKVVNGSA
jgi:hypothetical protein